MVAFNLMNLPPEIRNLIYEYTVTQPHAVTFRVDAIQQQAYSEAVQPALTRVSRQLRAESLPVFYGCNNFVLHTEGPKADDAQRWLRCNAHHLVEMRHLSIWLCYITLDHNFSRSNITAQGVLSISLIRPTKFSEWAVEDGCRWVTVRRKPAQLDGDVKFIINKLRGMTSSISKLLAEPDDYMNLMMDLKTKYMLEKMT